MTNRLRRDQRGSPDGAHRTLHTEHKTGGTQSVVEDIRDLGSAPCPRPGEPARVAGYQPLTIIARTQHSDRHLRGFNDPRQFDPIGRAFATIQPEASLS